MLAFFAFELHAEGFLEGGPDGAESREVVRVLDAGAGVAGGRGQEEGDLAGVVKRGGVEQNALGIGF
jgi:hypothetical protein